MKKKESALFFSYLCAHILQIAFLLLCFTIFAVILYLYDLHADPVLYAALLCAAVGLLSFILSYLRFHKQFRRLESALLNLPESRDDLPEPSGSTAVCYDEAVRMLCTKLAQSETDRRRGQEENTDYFTMWVHQIKTPIAAMDLLLQEDDSPRRGELEMELLKIGQYVEMVLSYLRLDSDSTDYVLREYPLDDILRQAVRKFAKMFILKKITLDFQETGKTVLTDEKWLLFVVEQVLSNALKYTPEGGTIRIYGDGATVVIADNGIGIREEDQARVFEKGYTGYNGRADKKSTGIGLYLCRQVMDRLNHGISLTSRPGQGTLVRLDLSREWRMVE